MLWRKWYSERWNSGQIGRKSLFKRLFGLSFCTVMLLDGKLNEHLHEIDEKCHTRMEVLVEHMKAGAGITEELKATNQMKWVGLMNNVRSVAEEVVIKELIYV